VDRLVDPHDIDRCEKIDQKATNEIRPEAALDECGALDQDKT
jgi:hypothetical protein